MMPLRKIKKRAWIVIGVAVIVVAVILFVITRRYANSPVKFTFTKVGRGNIENTVSSTGTLSAKGTVEVGTQVSGTVDKVFADFNDRVRKGQVLVVLDSTTLAASVREATANSVKVQAQHDLSQTKYEDAQELFANGLIAEIDFKTTRTEYESARAALLSAEANLVRAQTNLKYAVIRSPIKGTVINRTIEPGQTVAASFSTPTLFVIAEDLSRMEIHALVDESDIGQIKKGQAVRFTVDAYPDETFTGTIRQIRLQPETIQNVVNYTVVIDAANDSEVLLPGMTATVDFIIEQRQGVLLIANAALQFQPTKKMLSGTRPDPQNRRSMSNDSTDERLADFQHDTLTQSNSPSAGAPVDLAILWYLDKEKRLRALPVRIGVSDGKNTEIIEARGLKEGMEFVNGTTERGASANNTSNTRQQNRMPGPPPMF